MTVRLGIDIGGTGIKGAPVDTDTGEFTADRFRLLTPHPATPNAVADVVAQIVEHFSWTGPVGTTFPAVIKDGVVMTAANVDDSWIGTNAATLFSKRLGVPVGVMNDADAAGVAEMTFGAGAGHGGTVIVVTLGTGIGTAVFIQGRLVPNTELGHIEVGGVDAESRTSDRAREVEQLSWKKWAKRLDRYFETLEALLWPDLIIVGGGVSKKSDRFLPRLHARGPIIPAELLNQAGIVGAALAAGAGPLGTVATGTPLSSALETPVLAGPAVTEAALQRRQRRKSSAIPNATSSD